MVASTQTICSMYKWQFELMFTNCSFFDIQISFVQLALVIWVWRRRPGTKSTILPLLNSQKENLSF